MVEADRLLGDRGAVGIIIKPHVRRGVVVRYWHDTVTALFDDGWDLVSDMVWWKPDAVPVGHQRLPRLSHEHVYWFSKRRYPYCAPKAGGRWSNRIGLLHGNATMHQRPGKVRSGIARASSVIVLPPTVIRASVGTIRGRGSDHPAQHPVVLYEQLIRIFCPPDGLVMDPFIGSGTCAMGARRAGRHYIGYDISERYVTMAQRNLERERAARSRPLTTKNPAGHHGGALSRY